MDALDELKQLHIVIGSFIGGLMALFALVWNWNWIASNLLRALGSKVPIWQERAALLHVSYDDQGFVESIIYVGGEGERSNEKFWIRRWQKVRGILWQVPGSARARGIALVDGVLVIPTEEQGLIGVDIATGERRWAQRLSDDVKEGPRRKQDGLLYLQKDGAWLCVHPGNGKHVSSGKLTSTADEAALFADSEPVLHGVHSGGLSDFGRWGREELRVRLPQPSLRGRLGLDETSYESLSLTVGVFKEQDEADDEDRFPRELDATAYVIKAKKPPAFDWREELTPLSKKDLRVNAGQWFEHGYALGLENVKTPRLNEATSVLWLVDFERRRLLMQIGERLDSWVMGPTGRVPARF